MSDTQGSSSNGERDAEDLDGVPEADASSADGTAPAVDFGDAPKAEADVTPEAAAESPADPTVEADAPLDEAPSAFLADDPAAANEVDYEALAAELDRLEAETAAAAPVSPSQPEPEPSQAEEPVTKADPWFEPAKTEVFAAAAVPVEEPAAAPAPATVVEETVPPAPIFVQAPELPRKRGNRGATGLIGLVAALVFAALYGAALYGWQVFVSLVPAMNISPVLDPMDFIGDVLLSGPYWVTVVAFWLAFWLLGVFVNRARWWSWVVLEDHGLAGRRSAAQHRLRPRRAVRLHHRPRGDDLVRRLGLAPRREGHGSEQGGARRVRARHGRGACRLGMNRLREPPRLRTGRFVRSRGRMDP
jgi:hypothetical protein